VPLWLKPSKTNSKPMIESRCTIASSKDYLTFVLEQLSDLDSISYRAMMGEYILYYRDKIVGGIYDDRLLVKPVSSAIFLMPTATYELPYEGAKEMLLVDDVDSREFLCNLFLSMYDELPAPKKKTPPPKNSDKKPLAMSFIPTAKGFVYNMDLFVAQPPVIIL
jgi:TfoX/Sxy family transcriptional regulator of competence genes